MVRVAELAVEIYTFNMADEMDSYNDDTDQTLIAWTWVGWTEAE